MNLNLTTQVWSNLTDLSASFGLKFKENIREGVLKELMRLEKAY
nr:hypothetical protein [uncultured Campylobacter sp.]